MADVTPEDGADHADHADHVDRVIDQWLAVRPDLDLTPTHIVLRIERLAVHLGRAVDEVLDAAGVHRSGFAVLSNLRRTGPPYRLTPTQLRNNLLSTWGAVVNRLDRLEEAGLVRRLPDPTDRRGRLIELTDEGLALTDALVEKHLENQARLLSGLDAADQQALGNGLRLLLRNLEEGGEPSDRADDGRAVDQSASTNEAPDSSEVRP